MGSRKFAPLHHQETSSQSWQGDLLTPALGFLFWRKCAVVDSPCPPPSLQPSASHGKQHRMSWMSPVASQTPSFTQLRSLNPRLAVLFFPRWQTPLQQRGCIRRHITQPAGSLEHRGLPEGRGREKENIQEENVEWVQSRRSFRQGKITATNCRSAVAKEVCSCELE